MWTSKKRHVEPICDELRSSWHEMTSVLVMTFTYIAKGRNKMMTCGTNIGRHVAFFSDEICTSPAMWRRFFLSPHPWPSDDTCTNHTAPSSIFFVTFFPSQNISETFCFVLGSSNRKLPRGQGIWRHVHCFTVTSYYVTVLRHFFSCQIGAYIIIRIVRSVLSTNKSKPLSRHQIQKF